MSFFEIVTLVQTKKLKRVPIILYSKEYWEPLLAFIKKTVYEKHHAINKEDMDLFVIVDTIDEAYEHIIANVTC